MLDELEERSRRQRALTAALESLSDTYAAHWPAIVEADGDALARQLLSHVPAQYWFDVDASRAADAL